MIKVKLTISELARRAGRKRSTLYDMKKAFPDQYRLMVIGALSEMIDEAKRAEVERMS